MSVLTDIIAGLWIFFTGAAAARFAFERRKKQVINLHIDSYLNYPKRQDDLNPSNSTGIEHEENNDDEY